jgi:hypothetical protein
MEHPTQPTQYIDVRAAHYESQTLERLARIETKIDHISTALVSHEQRIVNLEKQSGPDPDHEARIRKLERTIWMIAGAAATAGGTAGGLISQLFGA